MGTLTSYLKWRGDLSFKISPFNIFDELVFSGIAYLDIRKGYEAGTSKNFGELLDTQMKKGSFRTTSLDRKGVASDFIKEVAKCKRFRSAVIIDYEDDYSSEDDVQFAAMTFKLDDGSIVVAYRGTDNSIAGWREDFMITFTKPKAQDLALKYLARTLKRHKNVYVCGHSKGGNLAIYAASSLTDRQLRRVSKVYVNDGPGLCDDVIPKDKIKRIDSKTTMIMPSDSIFGRIFEADFSDKIIVKSLNQGVRAHSIYSWEIEDNDIVRAKGFSKASDFIKEFLNKMLDNQNLEQRKALVNNIFDMLKENGYERLTDFKEDGFSELLGVFRKILEEGMSSFNFNPKKRLLAQIENIKARILEERA